MKKPIKLFLLTTAVYSFFSVLSCRQLASEKVIVEPTDAELNQSIRNDSLQNKSFEIDSNKIAFGFDFPVGKPDGKGYYNYQGFTKNNHLGEDWNGVGGGNSDLGDTIYAIGNGEISYAADFGGGWGNTVRVLHELPNGKFYESVYAHCDTLLITKDSWVLKGEPIGTIGTANGMYYAHLHLELREEIGLPIGNGYSVDTTGYLNPTTFIKSHRTILSE